MKNIKRKTKAFIKFQTIILAGLLNSLGCGPEIEGQNEEELAFENPKSDENLNLGQDEASNFSFHRIYNYYSDGIAPYPYVTAWASYFDPGLVYSSFPVYLWEHPFYTNAFFWDAWGLNDDDGLPFRSDDDE